LGFSGWPATAIAGKGRLSHDPHATFSNEFRDKSPGSALDFQFTIQNRVRQF
jgi:hypothetical protein